MVEVDRTGDSEAMGPRLLDGVLWIAGEVMFGVVEYARESGVKLNEVPTPNVEG